MATNSIESTLVAAGDVALSSPIRVCGINTYTISSDFISWNDVHNHTISDIAADFGRRVPGTGDKIFMCGDDRITVYDFGLLYTVFHSMNTAYAELGLNFPVEEAMTSREGLRVLWLGNDAIVYAPELNLILPIDNASMQSTCMGTRIECGNFCNKDIFRIDRERMELFITDAQRNELLCRFRICNCAQSTYSKCFEEEAEDTKKAAPVWDPDSILGKLVESAGDRVLPVAAFKKYKKSPVMEAVSTRSELFVTPSRLYENVETREGLEKMFGNVAYTDKDEVIIAVNHRSGMLVFCPCFTGDIDSGLQIDAAPNCDKFYDVTKECEAIMRYASTVVARPLTAAQLDIKVYNAIGKALMNMELKRISFSNSLGRVVVPESILESAFEDGFGADLFCMVPVGMVGESVICKTPEGNLEAIYPRGWTISEAFYDITEVIERAKH